MIAEKVIDETDLANGRLKSILPGRLSGAAARLDQAELAAWLLQSPEYVKWLASPIPTILWYPAAPGTGKSFLLAYVVSKLLDEEHSRRPNIVYYFCNSDSTESSILRSIFAQLLRAHPEWTKMLQSSKEVERWLLDMFQVNVRGTKDHSQENIWPLLRVVLEFAAERQTLIFIDGINEMGLTTTTSTSRTHEQSHTTFSKKLGRFISHLSGRISIFLTTRPYPAILEALKDFPSIDPDTEMKRQSVSYLH